MSDFSRLLDRFASGIAARLAHEIVEGLRSQADKPRTDLRPAVERGMAAVASHLTQLKALEPQALSELNKLVCRKCWRAVEAPATIHPAEEAKPKFFLLPRQVESLQDALKVVSSKLGALVSAETVKQDRERERLEKLLELLTQARAPDLYRAAKERFRQAPSDSKLSDLTRRRVFEPLAASPLLLGAALSQLAAVEQRFLQSDYISPPYLSRQQLRAILALRASRWDDTSAADTLKEIEAMAKRPAEARPSVGEALTEFFR
jgi:hypothetical protein